ncbi:GFA family protein [Parasalinivibrio latis]|uniref:GFA family protein n=1 Tax=Parasalinivibrio latis TaxID=2952610 RepID=UPI0030E14722
MTFPIEASCQCGQVSYVLKSAPLKVFACHCTECQKLSTSPFSVTAMVDANDIEFSGELGEWRRKADSGNINGAKFCTGCGNRIYHFSPSDMSIIKLKLKPTAADTAYLFEPQAHVWVSEKQSWYEIPEGVKVFDKQP